MRFFCDMTTTPKLGTKDLLKAQRWVVERESNLQQLLYKLNSLTSIPSLPYTITPLNIPQWGEKKNSASTKSSKNYSGKKQFLR